MSINLADIESLQKYPNTSGDLLVSLQLVSLDACAAFHDAIRIPQHFGNAQKLLLQSELRDYFLPAGAKTSHCREWVFRVLRAYEANFGLGHTELFIEWMSHAVSAPMFGGKLQSLIRDVQRGDTTAQMPERIARFDALCDVLTDYDDDAVEAALLPANLRTDWDKHCLQSNYWPEEDEINWNPCVWAESYIIGTGTYLAWENACRNPRITRTELDELHAWVMANTPNSPADLPRPETMFLPPRLRAEYEARGLIATDA